MPPSRLAAVATVPRSAEVGFARVGSGSQASLVELASAESVEAEPGSAQSALALYRRAGFALQSLA
jgi:hypothetical protein